MVSWIILIDHGIASQPIIEHYSQFVMLARVNPKIDRQGQRIIIKYTDCNRANKRNFRRFGEFSSLVHVTSTNNMSPDFFVGHRIITSSPPLNATHTLQADTLIYHHKSHHKSKLIMMMQLIKLRLPFITIIRMFEIFHCSVVSLQHHGILAGCSDKELLLQFLAF